MKLSVIIPVFNEEKTVAQVISRLAKLRIENTELEIVVVDDGSTDETWSVISNFPSGRFSGDSRGEANFKYVRHKKNMGKGAAIKTGIAYAKGDYIIIQDADAEYNPNDIEKLILPIQNNEAKVVYGTRLKRLPNFFRDEKTLRFAIHYFGNKFLSLITSILYGQWITDMETGYKIFPTQVVKKLNLKSSGFGFEPEITAKLLKLGYKIKEIPIKTNPRGYDEGKKLHTVRDGFIALYSLLKFRLAD